MIYFYIPDYFLGIISLQFCFLLYEIIDSSPNTFISRKCTSLLPSCTKVPSSFSSQHRLLPNQPLSSPHHPCFLLSLPLSLPLTMEGIFTSQDCVLKSSPSASTAICSITLPPILTLSLSLSWFQKLNPNINSESNPNSTNPKSLFISFFLLLSLSHLLHSIFVLHSYLLLISQYTFFSPTIFLPKLAKISSCFIEWKFFSLYFLWPSSNIRHLIYPPSSLLVLSSLGEPLHILWALFLWLDFLLGIFTSYPIYFYSVGSSSPKFTFPIYSFALQIYFSSCIFSWKPQPQLFSGKASLPESIPDSSHLTLISSGWWTWPHMNLFHLLSSPTPSRISCHPSNVLLLLSSWVFSVYVIISENYQYHHFASLLEILQNFLG